MVVFSEQEGLIVGAGVAEVRCPTFLTEVDVHESTFERLAQKKRYLFILMNLLLTGGISLLFAAAGIAVGISCCMEKQRAAAECDPSPDNMCYNKTRWVEVSETLPGEVEYWHEDQSSACATKMADSVLFPGKNRQETRELDKPGCISNLIVQQHETWEFVMNDVFQSQAIIANKENAEDSGWDYYFFDSEERERYVKNSEFWKNAGLVVHHDTEKESGRQFQLVPNLKKYAGSLWRPLDLYVQIANNVTHTVPLRKLFDLLPDGVMKADLFRYMIIYEKGGVYFDSKSGVQYSREQRWPDDTNEYNLTRVFHETEATFWLSHWFWIQKKDSWGNKEVVEGEKGFYVDCDSEREILQWMLAAHPRHRYLWRVIELVASQIFMLATHGDFFSQAVSAGCRDVPRQTLQQQKDHGMKVSTLTGSIAFTNAILLEQRRMEKLEKKHLGMNVEVGNGEKHIRYANVRWPKTEDMPSKVIYLGVAGRAGAWISPEYWSKIKTRPYKENTLLIRALNESALEEQCLTESMNMLKYLPWLLATTMVVVLAVLLISTTIAWM